MIHIDHVCLGTQNVYEGSYRLMQETGLGCYEGGWFPKLGLANRIFPTGGDTYIEVESAIDIHAYERGNPAARFFHDQCIEGDVFIGWCARVDTRDEIEAIAKRLGSDVVESGLRQRPDGALGVAVRTPDTIPCWEAGLPNFFYVIDPSKHPGRGQAQFGTVRPTGISWLEVGGTEEAMSDFLGMRASDLGLRFNGRAHGLHAMGIASDAGEIVVRRNVIKGTTGKVEKLDAYI
ncbi:VOC family protein [Mesorhizobium sp. J428]|uniref:VOC family protein n=1 Tax=Mesorhizobium sp. J428 TaxID=2898440 RepID=UPI002150FC35|nr:VOC family protein [Mesorhizobium sp. J428]MCR5857510.1 VOC family protein [Mesorhizobium sp. J428]